MGFFSSINILAKGSPETLKNCNEQKKLEDFDCKRASNVMAIIRVGLIGLTPAQEFASTRSWTALGHLPSLLQSPSYEIVALANSSVESAKRSIEAHNLPSTTKAYGSPEDIANDPEVDLIVVSVRVQKHYELIKPALLKNKKVFVEWPLGANLNEVEELTQLANSHGVQNAVGLQARSSPLM
ncbi:hypothetical protein Trihar35433_8381 [Trichoderma harzianum]|nr:hypothetical protein Trihar35433_8381 [Trichoderma harzianum]